MTLHRKSATLTCDAYGYAEDDITVYPTTSVGRLTELYAVRYASSDGDSNPRLTVREVDSGDEDVPEETPGSILFYVERADDRFYYPVGTNGVDEVGVAVASLLTLIPINTNQVRVELVSRPDAAGTVYVYYKTAGDQRF
jgi:hypothetical protein